MNVNDLHPQFRMNLTDTNISAFKYQNSEDWMNIEVAISTSVFGIALWSITISDVPTKTGVTLNMGTRILTVNSPTDSLPDTLIGRVNINSFSFYEGKYIKFVFSGTQTDYWYDGHILTFTRIADTNTYSCNDTTWISAQTITFCYEMMMMSREETLNKNTTLTTRNRTASTSYYEVWFNYYPSGLLIKATVKVNSGAAVTQFTCNLHKHAIITSNSENTVVSIRFLSPVPKIYCFFTNNSGVSQWCLTNNSWVYNSSSAFWEQSISFNRYNNSFLFNNIPYQVVFNTLIFIDPMLWEFRDACMVNANQTEDDVALYPICKTSNTNNYYINNTNLAGIYNFLTSVGALYQYPGQINKLKTGYVTLHSNTGLRDIGGTNSSNVTIDNQETIPLNYARIYPQYGSIKDKAIMRDNSFQEDNDRYRGDDDNVYLVDDTAKQDILIKTTGTIETFWLDEYYLYANKKIWRLAPGYKVILLTRTASTTFTPTYLPGGIGWGIRYNYQSSSYGDGSQMYLHLINTTENPGTYNSTYNCAYSYETKKLQKDGTKSLVDDSSNFNSYWKRNSTASMSWSYNIALNGFHFKTLTCKMVSMSSSGTIVYGLPINYGTNLLMNFTCNFSDLYQCNLEPTYSLESKSYSVVDHTEQHWNSSLYTESGYTMRRYYHKKSNTIKIADEINFKPEMPNVNGLFNSISTTNLIDSTQNFTIYDNDGEKMNYVGNVGTTASGNVVALTLTAELPRSGSSNIQRYLCAYKE